MEILIRISVASVVMTRQLKQEEAAAPAATKAAALQQRHLRQLPQQLRKVIIR